MSRLGLGCSRFGSFSNTVASRDLEALVRGAIDLGVTLIDTANIYGQGDSERIIGRALCGGRDNAFVVTKTGQSFATVMRVLQPLKAVVRPLLRRRGGKVTARREGVMRTDWRPESIAPSLEGSLRRLRTDHVDGFLLHIPPVDVIADPRVRAAMVALRQAGKARRIGVSCSDLTSLEAALAVPEYTLLELPFDLLPQLGPAGAGERGVQVIAREVLRLQPGAEPGVAVRNSVLTPLVASTLIGTTRLDHLAQIVEAVGA